MQTIRRENLQRLIDNFEQSPGNRAAFCRTYGFDALQIGQYFTGGDNGRNIGERKARAIEEAVGLDLGWLDKSHNGIENDIETRPQQKNNTPSLSLVYVDHDELALLTHLRQATAAGREILINFATTIEKDQAKLKKLSKAVG